MELADSTKREVVLKTNRFDAPVKKIESDVHRLQHRIHIARTERKIALLTSVSSGY